MVQKCSKEIFAEEGVNITKVSTMSSCSWKIFKTNYLKKNTLYQVKGPAHYNMREGFFGGHSEVYKTRPSGEVRVYDLNSSYPYSMLNRMPVGLPTFSTDPNLDNYFGIVRVRVETPKNKNGKYIEIPHPPLPFRKEDGSLINPIGR